MVSLRSDTDLQPGEYFQLAHRLAPDLRTIENAIVGPIVVDTHPGFIATYEQRNTRAAQKAVAAILVEGDATCVTSCGTSAALYTDLEPTFRRVIESLRFRNKN